LRSRAPVSSALAAALVLGACRREEPPPLPLYGNGLASALEEARRGHPPLALPEPAEDRARELADLVEVAAAAAGTPVGRAAQLDLVDSGDEAVPLLLRAALDGERDARERALATELLRAFAGSEAAAEAAMRLAEESGDEIVRATAARVLGGLGHRWVLPRAILRLKYEKSDLAAAILAEALAHLGNFSGLPALAEVLRRGGLADGPEFARGVLDPLGVALRGDPPIEALVEALLQLERGWREGEVPPGAVSGRLRLEWLRRVEGLGSTSLRTVDDARFVLARGGPEVVPLVLLGLDDSSPFTRIRSMEVLGWLGRSAVGAVPRLLELRADPAHRAEPLLALAKIGDRRATPILIEALEDPESGVRIAALRALAEIADPAAQGALRAMLDASDAVGDEAEEALFAAWGLVRLGDLSAVSVLARIAVRAPDRVEEGALIRALSEASHKVRGSGGDDGGFAEAASPGERDAAVRRWLEAYGPAPSPPR